MPNRHLVIKKHFIPEAFHDLVGNMPNSQVVREVSCDCHEVDMSWQRNEPGHCLPHAFTQGGQKPKWLVISCMDSRFPIEATLGVGAHQICSIRVAGGHLKDYRPDSEAWHSINLALQHFKTIQGIAIIGHSGCGSSGDLVSHFKRAKTGKIFTHLYESIGAFYNHDDKLRAQQAIEVSTGSNANHLSYDFLHADRTEVNIVTLLGLASTEKAIADHLARMEIDLPVCTMMVSIHPSHKSNPISFLVRQSDSTWENALDGRQPDIEENMRLCPRNISNYQSSQRIIAIVPENAFQKG